MKSTLVIGAGNTCRQDDAAGIEAAARVKEKSNGSFTMIEQSGEATALMEAWRGFDRVIIIDAVRSGAKPGTIHRWNAGSESIPRNYFHNSTHTFGVVEAIEMARALGELPFEVIVFGIEGKSFDIGAGLSSEVEKAAEKTAEMVLKDIC
jgi:hydrogenase maturation protease